VQVSYDGRHLDFTKTEGIDVLSADVGSPVWRRVCSRGPFASQQSEVSEGSIRQRYLRPTKPGRLPFRVTARYVRPHRRKQGVEGPEASGRAVKRGAVGGRMTARWSGAAGGSRRKPVAESGLDVERRRVSHGARRAVSKRDVFSGARDVNVGCRNELEATLAQRPRNAARR